MALNLSEWSRALACNWLTFSPLIYWRKLFFFNYCYRKIWNLDTRSFESSVFIRYTITMFKTISIGWVGDILQCNIKSALKYFDDITAWELLFHYKFIKQCRGISNIEIHANTKLYRPTSHRIIMRAMVRHITVLIIRLFQWFCCSYLLESNFG